MRVAAALLAGMFFLAGASHGHAGPVADAGARAEALSGEGKTLAALSALDDAVDAVWTAAPLTFRKALPVARAAGFGLYQARPDARYRVGETVTVYVEPVGFLYGRSGAFYTIGLVAGLAIENGSGQVLAEARDLFDVAVRSRHKNREFNLSLSFAMPDLKPGDYVGTFTVRDRHSQKSGSFDIPFSVTP